MGTTSAAVANAALASLEEAGVEFAFLHGEADLAGGAAPGDVDLVVDRPCAKIVTSALDALAQRGLHPVTLWVQDVGGGACLFCATEDASEGVQLDLLYDPDGLGKFGLRTNVALQARVPGNAWPQIDAQASLVYLISKRHWKRDRPRLEALLAQARQLPGPERRSMVDRLLAPPYARLVSRLVEGPEATDLARPRTFAASVAQAARHAVRVVRPAGYWVDLTGSSPEAAAADLAGRFARLLPHALSVPRPGGLLPSGSWRVSTVAPVHHRAGLIVSWSPTADAARWRPDLRLSAAGSNDDRATTTVTSMRSRVLRQLRQ